MYHIVVILCFCYSYVVGDLYNSSDPMIILNNKNFYESILSSKDGWIVEFYNSWCGHCISFAPTWREFSTEVKDWSHTFKVGVIDCSDEENVSICRDYEIMGYPTVRLFGAYTKKGDLGVNVQNRGVKAMQDAIIDFIIEKQTANNMSSSPSWVNLLPYNGSIINVFDNASSQVKFTVLIIDKSDSILASYSILDLGKYPMIYVRSMNSNSKEVADLNLRRFPSLLVVDRSGKREVLKQTSSTSEELTAIIIHHLGLMKQLTEVNSLKPARLDGVNLQLEKTDQSVGKPEEINSERLNYDDDLPDTAFNAKHHQVYMVDIENAISYALSHEVIMHKTISAESLISLKNFIKVIIKYVPLRSHVHEFLLKLQEFLLKSGDQLQGTDMENALQFLESPSAKFPDKQPWKDCQGSQSNFRGYPCGLWTLFHTITVGAYVNQEENSIYDPQEPLKAIHGYVKYFFSCEYCSKHFQEMYNLDAESSVRAPGDEVLWLWKGHNKVNKRLKGELSEDPKHPKEQFPSKAFCTKCWTEEGELFNPDEVILYLKKVYGKDAISNDGVQEFSKEEQGKGNKQANVFNSRKDNFMANKHISSISIEQQTDQVSVKNSINSWGFNSTDLNLCVLLYLISTLIIAAGYFMFILKRRLRRKKYFELYKLP